jgi:hypothetical protein
VYVLPFESVTELDPPPSDPVKELPHRATIRLPGVTADANVAVRLDDELVVPAVARWTWVQDIHYAPRITCGLYWSVKTPDGVLTLNVSPDNVVSAEP